MRIKRLYIETLGLEDCVGRFSKYFKARKILKRLDKRRYNAEYLDISAGKNTSVTDELLKHSDLAELENLGRIKKLFEFAYSNKKIYGTLKADVKYESGAVDWNQAYADLKTLREDTGINFRLSSIVPDTKIFTGEWDVEEGVDRIWPKIDPVTIWNQIWTKDLDRELELAGTEAEITQATICFVGILSNSEKKEVSRMVDGLYLPEFTGFTYKKEFRDEYRNNNYITRIRKHQEIKNIVPFIVVEKRWLGFDEEIIQKFYNKIKSYEKTEYLKTMDFCLWPRSTDPSIKIYIASKAAGKRIYSSYEMREQRGIEYDLIKIRNEKRDIIKRG